MAVEIAEEPIAKNLPSWVGHASITFNHTTHSGADRIKVSDRRNAIGIISS